MSRGLTLLKIIIKNLATLPLCRRERGLELRVGDMQHPSLQAGLHSPRLLPAFPPTSWSLSPSTATLLLEVIGTGVAGDKRAGSTFIGH